MADEITLALPPYVEARFDRKSLRVLKASGAPHPKSGTKPRPTKIIRRPDPLGGMVTCAIAGPDVHGSPELLKAPVFTSFRLLVEEVARGALGPAGKGETSYARLRVGGDVPLAHIREAAAALPKDSKLVVGVEWDDVL